VWVIRLRINVVVFITLIIMAALLSILIPLSNAANTVGPNYKNVTVRTSVNITNAMPEVLSVNIYDVTNNSLRNITVNAGLLKISQAMPHFVTGMAIMI